MTIVLLLLYALIIILGMCRNKSRAVFVLEFLFAWLLIAGNFDNADYEQYLIRYQRDLGVLTDPGFSLLCNLFNGLGWDYQSFKALLSFVCLLLVFSTIHKMSRYPALGGAIFLIFPFIIDITQFRNFVSYSIVIGGLPYLFKPGKRNLLKYSLIVLVAGLFHTASLFYLSFVLTRYRLKVWHVAAMTAGVFVVKEAVKLFFSATFETNKLEAVETSSMMGAIFGSVVLIMGIVLIWYAYRQMRPFLMKHRRLVPYLRRTRAPWLRFCTQRTWLYCNILFLMIIPFLFDNGNYIRICRNMALMNMLFVSNAFYIKKKMRTAILVVYYAYFVGTTYLIGNNLGDVFMPAFQYNNLLLG